MCAPNRRGLTFGVLVRWKYAKQVPEGVNVVIVGRCFSRWGGG